MQKNEINPWIFLGSVTLGALGALTYDKLRPSAVIQQPQIQSADFLSTNHIHHEAPVQKYSFNRLAIKDMSNQLVQELKNLEDITCEIERVPNLVYDLQLKALPTVQNPMLGNSKVRSVYGGEGFLPEAAFVNHDCFILQQASFGPNDLLSRTKRWLRAGPRKHLLYSPDEVRAAVVVNGGICAGLNVIIRELTMSLTYNYKVKSIIGAKYGFNGVYNNDWVELTPQVVKQIHHSGGCFLGTGRNVFDGQKMLQELQKKGINQLYVVGGLGTIQCMQQLYQLIKQEGYKISVVVIPKSIENEIPIVDKSFGFESAVEEAQKALKSAYSESHSRKNAVGIVRLLGRHSGFLAMQASQAFRSVNICLVPEFQIDLYGPKGLLHYVHARLVEKGTCLIVVAEGVSQSLRDLCIEQKGKDQSGNVKFGDIGLCLKNEIIKFNREQGMETEVKYIDPQYMVRSTQANSNDTKMCSQLAQNTIHACMAGFTGFATAHVSNKTCLVPLPEINGGHYSNRISSCNIQWQRLIANTGQPRFLNDEDEQ